MRFQNPIMRRRSHRHPRPQVLLHMVSRIARIMLEISYLSDRFDSPVKSDNSAGKSKLLALRVHLELNYFQQFHSTRFGNNEAVVDR